LARGESRERQHYLGVEPLAAAGIQRQNTYHLPAPVATVGGHSELGAAALLKAVWWDMRLASLLTHFFCHRQHHQLHAHNAEEQIIHSKRLIKNC